MQDLQVRLIHNGIHNVVFRIINSKSAINETAGIKNMKSKAGNITVLQEPLDAPSSWQTVLDEGTDQILVVDRCGQLVYQVISPWSLLSYPYVKAAILSTYYDDPCGICNISDMEQVNNTDSSDEKYFRPASLQNSSSDSEMITDTSVISANEVEIEIGSSITSNTTNNFTENILEFLANQTNFTSERYGISYMVNETLNTTQHHHHSEFVHNTSRTVSPGSHSDNILEVENILQLQSESEIKELNTEFPNASSLTSVNFSNTLKNISNKPNSISINSSNLVSNNTNVPTANNMEENNGISATMLPLTEGKDGTVPIVMIIHSPHNHNKNDGTISHHEYVVLQTSNPDFHGHLQEKDYPTEADSKENDDDNLAEFSKPDKQRKHKHREKANSIKGKNTFSNETSVVNETSNSESVEKVEHMYYYKGGKKHLNKGLGESTEEQTDQSEVNQDVRKHGKPQKLQESSGNNTVEFHRNKGKYLHKAGWCHKKAHISHTNNPHKILSTDGIIKSTANKKTHTPNITENGNNTLNTNVSKQVAAKCKILRNPHTNILVHNNESEATVTTNTAKKPYTLSNNEDENINETGNYLEITVLKNPYASVDGDETFENITTVVSDVISEGYNNNNVSVHSIQNTEFLSKTPVKKNRFEHNETSASESLLSTQEKIIYNDNLHLKNQSANFYNSCRSVKIKNENLSNTGNSSEEYEKNEEQQLSSKQGRLHHEARNNLTSEQEYQQSKLKKVSNNEHDIQDSNKNNKGRPTIEITKTKSSNVTEEQTSSSIEDNNDSDGKGEDVIKHYSKLLKWLQYPLSIPRN